MATENKKDEEKVHSLQLPPPQKEMNVLNYQSQFNDADMETTKDDDTRTLKAKLKGYQTLGKLYKDERDKNQQLIQINHGLNARLEALKNPLQPPGDHDPAMPRSSLDCVSSVGSEQQVAPLEESTEHGHAGHSMTSPPSEGQGQGRSKVTPLHVDVDQRAGSDQGSQQSSSGSSNGSFDWEMAEATSPAASLAALAKDATKAYTALDVAEPDYKKLFANLEKCVQSAAPGIGSDLVRLSLQALKKERNERVKHELMTNMKARLKDRDRVIKELRAAQKAKNTSESCMRGDWVQIGMDDEQAIEALKRDHVQEMALLQQEMDDVKRRGTAHSDVEDGQKVAELKRELDDVRRQLSNEQVGNREALQALSDEQQRALSLQNRNEQLENKVVQLKRQCCEDEQIIEALTTQNRSLRGSSPTNDRGTDKLNVEVEVLKQQVTIYKEDFDQERRSREQAHSEKEALESNMTKLKEDFKHAQQEVVRIRQRAQEMEDEKREVHRLKREKCEELRLMKQQVDILQGQLRKLESERRRWHTAMYTPPAYYMQHGGGAPTPSTWTCKMCTYVNKHDSLRCEICDERAPTEAVAPPPPRPHFSTWTDELQCDNAEPSSPTNLVSRTAPMGPVENNLSGSPPHVQMDMPDGRNKRHPAKPH